MADGEEEPVVKVTLTTIYDQLLRLTERIGPVPGQVADHEVRIRAIERYLWIWIGASGILGAGVGQLISFLFNQ